MTNISILCIELIVCLISLSILTIKYKYEGIYTYSIIAFILASLMSLKIITVYNFDINLGIITFTSVFIASNIIVQKKGYDEVKKLILFVVISNVIAFSFLYLTSKMESSNINLFTNKSFDNIFEESVRLYFANIVTMLYILIFNSKLYYYLKRVKNKIWISNLFSGIIIQFIAACIFPIIAYTFIKEPVEILKLIIIRYMISLITIIVGTITIYIANKIKVD